MACEFFLTLGLKIFQLLNEKKQQKTGKQFYAFCDNCPFCGAYNFSERGKYFEINARVKGRFWESAFTQ